MRRPRGLCASCATDVTQNSDGTARVHGGRVSGLWFTRCPGIGQPVVAGYQPDEPQPVPETGPAPALTADRPQAAALRAELAAVSRERDHHRAEAARLAGLGRALLAAQRAMLESSALASEAHGKYIRAQMPLLDLLERTVLADFPDR